MSNTRALTKERDYWFDNAKAFLVITVVIGHIVQTFVDLANFNGAYFWLTTVLLSVYTFHMPVFIIISGRFSKKRIDTNDWISVINKLVIPYIIIQLLMTLFYHMVGYDTTSFKLLNPLFALWYLMTIAVYQLITPLLTKFKWLFPVSIAVAIICSFQKYPFFGGFQRIFTFYPFFLFGYYTSGKSFAFCKKRFFKCIAILAFIALPVVIYHFKDSFDIQLLAGKKVYSYFYENFGVSKLEHLISLIIRYIIGFLFFFFIMSLTPTKKYLFTKVGIDSIYVYIIHAFLCIGIYGIEKHFDFLDFNSDFVAIIIVVLIPFFCLLLVSEPVKKLTSWFIAPKIDIRKIINKLNTNN